MAIRESKTILTAEDRTGGAFASMQRSLQTTMGQFERWQGLMAGIAGGGAVGAFGLMIKNALDTGEALNKMSQKTGIAVEQLSELSYAAKLADVSNETLGKGIKALSESLVAANDPTSKQAKLFKELGVNIKGDTLSALEQLAKQYQSLPDGATKAALSTELFKKAGQDLIPFLNQGADGIAKLRGEARALGLTMTSETAKAAETFNDNLKTLQASTGKLGISLVNDLAPGLVKASDAMKEALIESGKLKAAWVGLGAVGAFLFTDDMLSSQQKINKEIATLQGRLSDLNSEKVQGGSWLSIIANAGEQGAMSSLDNQIKLVTDRLAGLQSQLDKLNKADAGATAKAAADAKAAAEGKAKEDALKKLLADQKAAADENAKHNERMRQLDIKGWVAYADQVFAEADELNKSLAEVADAYWKGEEKAKETDIKGWVAYIEAMEKEYEEGLKAIGDKQPSFFQAQQKEWEGYLGRIESGFSDIWTKLIDRSLSSWKQFTSSLRDMFKRTVSDFIYQAFAKPIVLQLVATAAGGLGISGLASAATGAAGAASGASSLLGLGSLGSMFGSVGAGATFGSSVGIGGTLANLGAGGGSFGFQAGSVMGAAGPYVAAALAAYQAYNAFRDKGENPKYRLGFGSAAQGYASDSIFGMQGFQYAQGNDAANQGFRNFQRGLGGLDTQIGGLLTPAQIAAAAGRLNGVTGREFSFPKGDPTASEQLSKEFLQIKYSAVFADLNSGISDAIKNFAGNSEELIKYIGEQVGAYTALNAAIASITAQMDGLSGNSMAQFTKQLTQLADSVDQAKAAYTSAMAANDPAEQVKAQNTLLAAIQNRYNVESQLVATLTAQIDSVRQSRYQASEAMEARYRTLGIDPNRSRFTSGDNSYAYAESLKAGIKDRTADPQRRLGLIDQYLTAVDDWIKENTEIRKQGADQWRAIVEKNKVALNEQLSLQQTQLDGLKRMRDFAESVKQTIDGIRTSGESPLSIGERYQLATNQLQELSTRYENASGDTRIKYGQQLVAGAQSRFQLGASMYDRSSDQYVSEYNEMLRILNRVQNDSFDLSAAIPSVEASIQITNASLAEQATILSSIDTIMAEQLKVYNDTYKMTLDFASKYQTEIFDKLENTATEQLSEVQQTRMTMTEMRTLLQEIRDGLRAALPPVEETPTNDNAPTTVNFNLDSRVLATSFMNFVRDNRRDIDIILSQV